MGFISIIGPPIIIIFFLIFLKFFLLLTHGYLPVALNAGLDALGLTLVDRVTTFKLLMLPLLLRDISERL